MMVSNTTTSAITAAPFTCHVDPTFIVQCTGKSSEQLTTTSTSSAEPSSTSNVSYWRGKLATVLQGSKPTLIKKFIRTNHWPVQHPIRACLWTELVTHNNPQYGLHYQDDMKAVFGSSQNDNNKKKHPLPSFSDPAYLPNYYLSDNGCQVARRLLCVVGNVRPDITYAPSVYSITCLLLHYMDEEDCYMCLLDLLTGKKEQRRLVQTKLAWEASRLTCMKLASKYTKSAHSFMLKISKQCGESMDSIFSEWLWWILRDLPFDYLVAIVDCYLVEGRKIFYRIALALISLFQKYSSRPSAQFHPLTQGTSALKMMPQFCQEVPVSLDKLLRLAFGIRGLKKKEIDKMLVESEMYARSLRPLAGGTTAEHLQRSHSTGSLQGQDGAYKLQTLSSSSAAQHDHNLKAKSRSLGMLVLDDFKSVAVTKSDVQEVLAWLPQRISTLRKPILVYTSEEHGTSMVTFFNKVDDHEPTLLFVRTTTDEVFGAYLSADWAERKHIEKGSRTPRAYFGTGESFVFQVYPNKKKHPWIGNVLGTPKEVLNSHSVHMFMASRNERLLIGGGNGTAIELGPSLESGRTGSCDTFNNPPLCSRESFDCRVVEVFAFA